MVDDYLALLHGEIERIVVLGKKGDGGEGVWMDVDGRRVTGGRGSVALAG